MKKKHWQVSVFDKTSETIRDDTLYTTDTEVYLTFELIDENFTPDSATVTIYNIYGTATINESVDIVNGIVNYEMPVDAIGHAGGWRTQVVFTKDNEDYTTTVIDFDVDGHLLDNNKPTIVYIENWNHFIKHGEKLVDDWEQLEKIRQANERQRELAESVRQNTFDINETSRQTNERVRENNESLRVSNEEERELNEVERISKDSERDSKIENLQSEVVSARGGEVVLGDRLDRIETTGITLEDFIGFQDAIGGRNYWAIAKESWHTYLDHQGDGVFTNNATTSSFAIFRMDMLEVTVGETYTVSFEINVTDDGIEFANDTFYVNGVIPSAKHNKPILVKDKWVKVYASFNYTVEDGGFVHIYIRGIPDIDTFQIRNFQLEKGNTVTEWTKAPEDYEEITLTDLGKHANIIFDEELTKIRNAIIEVGGNV